MTPAIRRQGGLPVSRAAARVRRSVKGAPKGHREATRSALEGPLDPGTPLRVGEAHQPLSAPLNGLSAFLPITTARRACRAISEINARLPEKTRTPPMDLAVKGGVRSELQNQYAHWSPTTRGASRPADRETRESREKTPPRLAPGGPRLERVLSRSVRVGCCSPGRKQGSGTRWTQPPGVAPVPLLPGSGDPAHASRPSRSRPAANRPTDATDAPRLEQHPQRALRNPWRALWGPAPSLGSLRAPLPGCGCLWAVGSPAEGGTEQYELREFDTAHRAWANNAAAPLAPLAGCQRVTVRASAGVLVRVLVLSPRSTHLGPMGQTRASTTSDLHILLRRTSSPPTRCACVDGEEAGVQVRGGGGVSVVVVKVCEEEEVMELEGWWVR